MKCDELQERWFEAYPVEGDQIIPTKVYGKKDADDAIAELKCELKDVSDDRNEFKKLYSEQTEKLCIEKTNVDTLEQALNQMQRTLWLARAERALEKIAWFKLWNASISTMNPEDGARQEFDKWKKNLGKFLKKAKKCK